MALPLEWDVSLDGRRCWDPGLDVHAPARARDYGGLLLLVCRARSCSDPSRRPGHRGPGSRYQAIGSSPEASWDRTGGHCEAQCRIQVEERACWSSLTTGVDLLKAEASWPAAGAAACRACGAGRCAWQIAGAFRWGHSEWGWRVGRLRGKRGRAGRAGEVLGSGRALAGRDGGKRLLLADLRHLEDAAHNASPWKRKCGVEAVDRVRTPAARRTGLQL